MTKTMKKLDSKLQKQQEGWPKISNKARKYNKDENLEIVLIITVYFCLSKVRKRACSPVAKIPHLFHSSCDENVVPIFWFQGNSARFNEYCF